MNLSLSFHSLNSGIFTLSFGCLHGIWKLPSLLNAGVWDGWNLHNDRVNILKPA